MASPYLLNNADIQFVQSAGQSFVAYLAFLNPVSVTTNWVDTALDQYGNPLPPPNFDTAANHVAPYAPICNMGPNRIGFVGEPLYFDGSRSCQRFDIPVVSYQWSYTGGLGNLYANNSQLSLVFAAPGIYTVYLAVTDKGGTIIRGQRQVMVYQDRQSALPGMIQLSGPQGSLSNGGWQMQINTVSSQFTLFNPDSLPVGTYQPLVVLVETSFEIQPNLWVNATIAPNGNFNPGSTYEDPRILFDGYVQQGTVHQDVDKDTLSFTCVGPQQLMNDAKTHLLGYYNSDYKGQINYVPTGINPSSMGSGFLVGGLMTQDVIQSILQYHSTIATYHDLHMWNSVIPTNPYAANTPNAYYNQVYATLSVTEGTVWQNLQDLTANEFSQVYCEHDGSIRIGPQANYRGQDFWSRPQLLGQTVANEFINFVQDLGYTVSSDLSQMPASIPTTLPALPMPIEFVHPWGPQTPVNPYLSSFQNQIDASVSSTQSSLIGPPVVCVFSDIPVYDGAAGYPSSGTLYPWTTYNWPQDLSITPISYDIQENYTGKASLVKLIGTLALNNSIYSAWYPQNAFVVQGSGGDNIQTTVLPAGDWILDESHVLPDMTTQQNRQLMATYWWEMARRYYYANNINYNGTITLGMCTFLQMGDIVSVTRQNTTLGPKFLGKLFYIDGISYQIDMTSRLWQTQITLTEITSAALSAIVRPPAGSATPSA